MASGRPDYQVGYQYDTVGRMIGVVENGTNLLATYAYDDLGRRIALGRANGGHSYYDYGGTPYLTAMTHLLAGGAGVTTGYAYDPAGQLVHKSTDNDAYAWAQNYNVARSYGVDGLNRYTSSGGVALGYDGRGNLNSAPTPGTGGNGATSGQVGYAYTADNLVVGANGQPFNYDALGRMTMDQADNRQFGYAGDRLLIEKDYNGAVVERYVYGADEAPLIRYDGAGYGTRRWLYADERGSVVTVVNDAATATAINRYDEYGIPASANDGRFGFTGQAWNRTLGMWNYKARIYSPTLGRFLQTNPIGYGDGLNWYNYVGGDPVNKTDPSGLTVTLSGVSGTFAPDIVVTGTRDPTLASVWGFFVNPSAIEVRDELMARIEQHEREFCQNNLKALACGGTETPQNGDETTVTAAVNCGLHPTDPRCGGVQLAQFTPVPPGALPTPGNDNTRMTEHDMCEIGFNNCMIQSKRRAGPGQLGSMLRACLDALDFCNYKADNPQNRSRAGDIVTFFGGYIIIFRQGRPTIITKPTD